MSTVLKGNPAEARKRFVHGDADMSSLRLIGLLSDPVAGRILESCGFSVASADKPDGAATILVEAARGDQVAAKLREWDFEPSRAVALCLDPTGLPPGCLWLAPQLLEQPRGQGLLRAWLADSKEDPTQALLAQISHDMRSPLSVISTAASLISKFPGDQTKTTRYLSLINESSGVLKSLVNDILDYSNIREGEFAFTASDFHLRHLLHSLTESFRLLVKTPETMEVSWRADADVPDFVHGDPGRLRQVLTNLMNNALKFTQQGRVELLASKEGRLLRFEVHDTGVGIRPEALQRIFLPYQQADKTIHSNYGGTGLGLTICQALVQRMGGRIWVESVFGEGSTFSFTADLPTVILEQPAALPELRGRRIFVGSTDPTLFTSALSSHNTLTVYNTVEEVERHLGDPGFDLHIMDLNLGDHFELAARLARQNPQAVIVVTTSAGQRGDVAQCKEIGVSGYLTTPLEPQELEVALGLAVTSSSNDIITKYSAKELLAGQKPG
jgi:signal transduction histidine kinase/CheY-like chemotaxis protein